MINPESLHHFSSFQENSDYCNLEQVTALYDELAAFMNGFGDESMPRITSPMVKLKPNTNKLLGITKTAAGEYGLAIGIQGLAYRHVFPLEANKKVSKLRESIIRDLMEEIKNTTSSKLENTQNES